MSRITILLTLALVLAGSVRAQDEAPLTPEQRARIDLLISKLDGEDFDQRESSFKELVAMGSAIRPAVSAARERVGLEVRLRLESLLEELGDAVETATVKLVPTLITLDAAEATFEEAVTQLGRQGIRFHSPPGVALDERVDLVLHERPLLEVLDALGDQLSMRWAVMARDGAIRFNGRTAGKPLRHYSGPFRFMLTAASRNATRVFGEELRQTSYIQGSIDFEPEAQILGMWHPPEIEEMSSEAGLSLIDDTVNQRANFNSFANRTSFHFSARVKLPEEPTGSIARLAGHILVAVPREYHLLTLPISKEAVDSSVTAGGVKATLESMTASKSSVQVVVFLEREPVWADDDQRQQVKDQIFELVTASGMTAAPSNQVMPRPDPKGDRFHLEFAIDERPESLTIRSLGAIEQRKITFEFTGVPLP